MSLLGLKRWISEERMVEKKGFFQRKIGSKASEGGTSVTAQQISEIAQQVTSLKQKIKRVEQEKEDIKVQYETLKQVKLQDNKSMQSQKNTQSEKVLNEQLLKYKQQVASLEHELTGKKKQIETLETKVLAEKDEQVNLSKTFDEKIAEKDSEIRRLTREKLEIKSEVSDVLLELQEHFAYKTALLESERELIAQEKNKQELQRNKQLEEWEKITLTTQNEADKLLEEAKAEALQMISKAEEEAATQEAQSRVKLSQLKERIEYYSAQINEAAQTIDLLLRSVSHL